MPALGATATEIGPESSALRVALWRALHALVDPAPHVLADDVGLALAAPDDGWRERGDMHPTRMSGLRAAMVARARFVDDLVVEQAVRGVTQYVVLGAGLDTFAQRHPELADRLDVFEIDQPVPQEWKRRRLVQLGLGVPDRLHLVPVDFEAEQSWWGRLLDAGFDPDRPAVVSSTGVSMYLTRATTEATLQQLAHLAAGSTVAMSFLLPPELLDASSRGKLRSSARGAGRSGTPFVSFYSPEDMVALVRDAGFDDVEHVAGEALAERYFTGRTDGLWPDRGEEFVVAER